MARYGDTFNKKEVRNKKEKKRKEKDKRRQEKKGDKGKKSFDDMIAYVDEYGNITNDPEAVKEVEETNLEDIEISTPKQEKIPEEKVKSGVLVYYNDSKAYGFIRQDNSDDKIFVHINSMVDVINEQDKVTFEVEKGPRGLIARDVRLKK